MAQIRTASPHPLSIWTIEHRCIPLPELSNGKEEKQGSSGMPGTFFGLETAGRALRMNQTVIDVVGHNVSNVNTPDYSRQTVEISATDPYISNTPGLPSISLGTGVEVASVTRVRDAFVEQRLNDSLAGQGRYKQLNDMLA